MTLLNMSETHPGATEFLQRNGFSVSRSSVPTWWNPVDIPIEQTIKKHAKYQGGILFLVEIMLHIIGGVQFDIARQNTLNTVLALTEFNFGGIISA